MKNKTIAKTSTFLLVAFFTSVTLFAQSEGSMTYSKMKNQVEKNILIFRIKTSSFFSNVRNEITDQRNPDFLTLLPSEDYYLKLGFSKIDSMEYPLNQYDLYGIRNWNYTYTNDSIEITRQYFDKGSCCDKYFLIAYDPNSGSIKYISGDFYKSMIAHDFPLSEDHPASFCRYIIFKLFNLNVNKVKFDRKSKSTLDFIGYSNELRSRIKIRVDRSDFEKILVEQISL